MRVVLVPTPVLAASSSPSPVGYAPSEIRSAYGLAGDDDRAGLGHSVAIVVAFHEPTVEADLARFIAVFELSPVFGLRADTVCTLAAGPHPCFQRTHAGAERPAENSAWALETAEDVQWVHAISPLSDILLVEAQTDRFAALLDAVDVAVRWRPDVVEMSWGAEESAIELLDDAHFMVDTTTFVAAAGDGPGMVTYPAASPYVVAVGATSLRLGEGGRRIAEPAWPRTGGGVSRFEPQAPYQARAAGSLTPRMRALPDVAANGDFNPGYAVTTTGPGGEQRWFRAGGSSGAAAVWAAFLVLAVGDCPGRISGEPSAAELYQSLPLASPGAYNLQTGLGTPDARSQLARLCPAGLRRSGS